MRTSSARRCIWMRIPSSFHSTDARSKPVKASATLSAVEASIGRIGRKISKPTSRSPASPSASASSAVRGRSPDNISARRVISVDTPAALAIASVMSPTRAPCLSSPVNNRRRKSASCAVARPTPTRPCRGTPERRPTAIGTSLPSILVRRSARIPTFRERELVPATSFEAVTTSASSVTAAKLRGGRLDRRDVTADVRRRFRVGVAERLLHSRHVLLGPVRELVVDRAQELERRRQANVRDRRHIAADERLPRQEERPVDVERIRQRGLRILLGLRLHLV